MNDRNEDRGGSSVSENWPELDVVAVAPHPDDLEILCGGTLAKLVKQGYQVGILDLTSGEPTPRGSFEKRKEEAEIARQALGVPFRANLDLPNRILMDSPEARFVLATALRKLKPKIMIAAAGRTPAASPDHHQGHLIAEASRFYSQLSKWNDRFDGTEPYRVPHLVYAYFPFDAEPRQLHSSFVVDITDTFEAKLASIRAYESQFDIARFEMTSHFIRSWNGLEGSRCGFMYGERFGLHHPVATSNLFQLVTGEMTNRKESTKPGQDHLPMG
jgi:N-acetylglucosamine malate deacetylase 1